MQGVILTIPFSVSTMGGVKLTPNDLFDSKWEFPQNENEAGSQIDSQENESEAGSQFDFQPHFHSEEISIRSQISH